MKSTLLNLSKNFYVLTGVGFLLWMSIFDSNDFLSQYQMSKKLSDMEEEKADYLKKMEEVKKDRNELLGSPQLLEKFARERYLMKKNTEEVFVIVNEENKPIE